MDLSRRRDILSNPDHWKRQIQQIWPLDPARQQLLSLATDCLELYERAKKAIELEGYISGPIVKTMTDARRDFLRILAQMNLEPGPEAQLEEEQ